MKGGTIMTMITNITGQESTRELLKIRRLDKRNRMQKRVEQLFGETISFDSDLESTDDKITHAMFLPLAA